MKRARAFTLVELLVVIGMIATLLAILLPVFKSAADHAHAAECAANMQSYYRVMIAYSSANDGVLPIPASRSDTYDPRTNPVDFNMLGSGVLDYTKGSIIPYLPDSITARKGMMNCPSDLEELRVSSYQSTAARNFSYSCNIELRGKGVTPSNLHTGIHLYDIVNPSHKIIVVEEAWPNDECAYIVYTTAGGDKDDVPAFRHLGKSNMGFADGHVERMMPADLGFSSITTSAPLVDPTLNNSYFYLFK